MAKVKTWVWVVVGVFAVCVLGVVALAAAGIWFARSHIDIQSTTPTAATDDFQRVRERFAGQQPLIELDERGHVVRAHTDRPMSDQRPESLHVMAFDPDDGRIVRLTIPFWLLRLKMRGTRIDVGGDNIDLEDLKMTVEDLERYGPTLIVDHKGEDGEHVLVWSQ
ncbi:MAG TPA: hypothetical protein VFK20_08215 [Vicinamibacterales bacterium]|nr:hypothetical protein [Vicinamibacterales bacterium]